MTQRLGNAECKGRSRLRAAEIRERHHGDRPTAGAGCNDSGRLVRLAYSIDQPPGTNPGKASAARPARIARSPAVPDARVRAVAMSAPQPLSGRRLALRRCRSDRSTSATSRTLVRARSRHNAVARRRRPSASRNSLTRWLIVSGYHDAAPDALPEIVRGQELWRSFGEYGEQVERQLRQRDLVCHPCVSFACADVQQSPRFGRPTRQASAGSSDADMWERSLLDKYGIRCAMRTGRWPQRWQEYRTNTRAVREPMSAKSAVPGLIATFVRRHGALACGDKLAMIGGGVSFERLAQTATPGRCRLLIAPDSPLSQAETGLKLTEAAAHGHPCGASPRTELESALHEEGADVGRRLLDRCRDRRRSAAASVGSSPTVVPVVYHATPRS